MARLPFPIAGPTYTNRSLPVSSQMTRGFYLEGNTQGNESIVLMPFPGLKLFSAGGINGSRGLPRLNDRLYSIAGNTLYSVDRLGNQTSIGMIEGSDRCGYAEDQVGNLVITTGEGRPYAYDGSTLTQGSDADLPNASTVTYINRRVVYDGSGGDIAFADLSDPLSVNSSNVIIAESKPDDMKAVIAFKQQMYGFGAKSIQPMYNSGTGNPPYSFILNATQEIGLDAVHSISSNRNFIYYLGSDLNVYQLAGLDSRPIGNPAIGQAISKYSLTSDAYGVCFTIDSMDFYLLSFPTGGETWLFNEQTGLWTSLAYGNDGDQHLISDYQFIYGKHLVSDRRNGNIYELDFDTYTDNGDTIHRRRDTVSISGATFGQPGAEVFMDTLGLVIEPGVSLVTDKSAIIMEFSDDNGRSWSQEMWEYIGQQGDYEIILEWHQLGSFKNRMFRFTMSDAIKWTLISGYVDVELSNG